MSRLAPATFAAAFSTSTVGASAYVVFALASSGGRRNSWLVLVCGAGGLVGGYLGARLRPHLPETALRLLLGALAAGLCAVYALPAPGLRRCSEQ